MTGRELFEKIYNDEMSIPDSHVFEPAQELNFEDADIREAAYAGFVLAMSTTHEHLSHACLAMEQLKAAVNGPINHALDSLKDEQATLSNFAYQMNRHSQRARETTELDKASLWPTEAVVSYDLHQVEEVCAPISPLAQLPAFVLLPNKYFKINILLESNKYQPIGFTSGTLHMANNPHAKAHRNPCVFLVLEIRGDESVYPSDYAMASREAYAALRKFANRCRNICPVGEMTPLGSSMNGSVVRAFSVTLFVEHDQFKKAQKV